MPNEKKNKDYSVEGLRDLTLTFNFELASGETFLNYNLCIPNHQLRMLVLVV